MSVLGEIATETTNRVKEEGLQAGTTGTSHLRSGKARAPMREGKGREEKWEVVTKKVKETSRQKCLF